MDETTTGWFGRLKNWLADEITLFARCIRSSSPDRSSAAVVFLVIIAGCLTCMFCSYLKPTFPKNVVPWLIISFEFAAAIVCVLLILCKARPSDGVTDGDLQPWHRFIRRNIKLISIFPFYFAIFIFDVLRLIADVTCKDARVACEGVEDRIIHIDDLFYPMARTVFLFIELLVCVKFNRVHIVNQTTLVLAGLAIVQATNLSVWLDALLHESNVFPHERNWTYELYTCFNRSEVNISDHFRHCFLRTTGEYQMLEFASPYLYPFIMEYLMLVTECVADWFFSDAAGRHDEAENVQQPQQRSKATGIRASSLFAPVTWLQRVFAGWFSSGTETVTAAPPPPQPRNRRLYFVVGCVILLLLNIVFVIFSVFEVRLDYDIKYRYIFTAYRIGYRIGYWINLLLAALIGYCSSRRFPSVQTNPNSFQYVVILSCIGPIMQCIFSIVAILQKDLVSLLLKMFLVEEIAMHILQICAQVAFYAYAKNIQIQPLADRSGNHRILMGVMLHFVMCNFALWVENSFVTTRSLATSWQNQYFEEWPVVYNFFNPLALFFRFNSVLLFLNVLFDIKHSSRSSHVA